MNVTRRRFIQWTAGAVGAANWTKGAIRAMTRGTVTHWAKFHHPGWYAQATKERR